MPIPIFVNTSFFFNICHHKFPLSLPDLNGQLLFVHPDHLEDFVANAMSKIQVKYCIVSAMSDHTIPHDFPEESAAIESNPNILYWFSANCMEPTHKRKQIPIGLKYPLDQTINHPFNTPFEKQEEQEILEVREQQQGQRQRQNKCYGNFHFSMITLYAQDRKDALKQIPTNLIDYESERISRKESLQRMKEYKFIVSPFGNGYDCHRTWEALILGCIPIIKSSGLDPMFEGLPVMIVKSWADITRERLDSFIADKSQMEKITMRFWVERLNSIRNNYIA